MTLNSRIYSGMLLLYPADLRREFGTEMSELFCDDLNDAWQGRGLAGAIGVWWCALCEVLRIAVPGQKTNPAFVVPAISFAYSVLIHSCELAAVLGKHPLPPHEYLTNEAVTYIFWPSLVTALTAIAVVRTGKVSMLSLQLKAAEGETDPCSKCVI